MNDLVDRRGLMRTVGAGVAGVSALGTAGASAGQDDAKASVTFEDQTTGGQEIVIAAVSTSVDARYAVRAVDMDESLARGRLDAGDSFEEFTVPLDRPLLQDARLAFSLYPDEGGQSFAREVAEVTVTDDVSYLDGMSVTRVDADPDAGFHYPYFLYAPPVPEDEAGGPILVEPNNTGTVTDDFEQHEERARQLARRGLSRDVSGRLGVPLLVPVFPRPRSDPVDGTHYVHQLDRDTMRISGGPLERVDLQLLRMVEHARQKLADASYPVTDDVIMNGFSASGNFVDRFTVLHPDRVLSVTAGGLNGMAILPLEEAKDRTLNFHVGVADVEGITGEPVDLNALDDVNQFLYMGGEDANDTIPYTDAWTSEKLRETALSVYGEDMLDDRFPYCQSAYEAAGVEAQFRVYEGVGHTPQPAKEDIIEFHRRSVEGEDVSEFGQQLGLHPRVERTAGEPAVGESVEFDATGSTLDRGEILAYTWDFGDGETAAGDVANHAFEQSGGYTVVLTVVDSNGRTAETEVELAVGGRTDGSETEMTTDTSETESETTGAGETESTTTDTDESEPTTTERRTASTAEGAPDDGDAGETTADEETSATTPGFGIGAAVTSLAAGTYALGRRARNDPEE